MFSAKRSSSSPSLYELEDSDLSFGSAYSLGWERTIEAFIYGKNISLWFTRQPQKIFTYNSIL